MTTRHTIFGLWLTVLLLPLPAQVFAAESGLVTKQSQHSVQETIERFETAVRANGWVVFTELEPCYRSRKGRASATPADGHCVR
jgi:hypothetical protein